MNASGEVQKFNDLPLTGRGNVNTSEGTYNRTIGQQPAMSASEIDDVVAF